MIDIKKDITYLKEKYNVDLFNDMVFRDGNFLQFYFDMTENNRKFSVISGDTTFIGSLSKDHFRSKNLYEIIAFDNIFAEVLGVEIYKKLLVEKLYLETESFSFLLPVKHENTIIWTRTRFKVITWKNNKPELVFGRIIEFFEDTEPQEVKLYKKSHQDPSTGLFNRETLKIHIKNNNDFISTYALYIDIDNFKEVNDNFGHGMGDLVLKEIANTFITNYDKDIIYYRLGGDEFFAKITNTNEKEVKKIAKIGRASCRERV